MAKKHKVYKTPACTIAMAGGKKHVNSKHALLVAAFAKRQDISFESAAGLVSKAAECLLDQDAPASVVEFASRVGTTIEVASDLLDALVAFGYIGVQPAVKRPRILDRTASA